MKSLRFDLIALVIAVLFPSLLAWVQVSSVSDHGQRHLWFQIAIPVAKIIQFSFPILWLWSTRGTIFVDSPMVASTRFSDIAIGLIFGLITAVGIWWLYELWLKPFGLLDETPSQLAALLSKLNLATPARFIVLASFICLFHSFLEEYYWRWFVFGTLRRHLSVWSSAVLSGLAFSVHHAILMLFYVPNVALAVSLASAVAVGGIAWAWLYERSGSLVAPWLSHLLVDTGLMAVGYSMMGSQW